MPNSSTSRLSLGNDLIANAGPSPFSQPQDFFESTEPQLIFQPSLSDLLCGSKPAEQ